MEHNFEKEFISYEQALHLKKLGFTDPCMASKVMDNGEGLVQLPLYQQAIRWLQQQITIQRGVMCLDEKEKEDQVNNLIKKLRIQHYER
jgi:hypothetical protein